MPRARFCPIGADLTFFTPLPLLTASRALLRLMHSFRHARRLLAAALTAWPLLAAAQDDCPPPPAPPTAETLALAQVRRATAASCGGWRRTAARPGCTARCTSRGWNGLSGPRVRGAGGQPHAGARARSARRRDAAPPRRRQRRQTGRGGRGAGARTARTHRTPRTPECAAAAVLAPLKPEFQVAALSMLVGRRLGLEPDYGIDATLAALAPRGRPVVALETAEDQLRAMSAPSRRTRRAGEGRARRLDSGRAQALLARMARMWASGDHALLERYAQWCECQQQCRRGGDAAPARSAPPGDGGAAGRAAPRRATGIRRRRQPA